jgi:hypothetical protein
MQSFVYIPVFILSMSSGMVAEGEFRDDPYPTYDACMVQAEHDAKNMVREWDEAEAAGRPHLFESVEVRCVKREVRDVRSR